MTPRRLVIPFRDVDLQALPEVGGKNAALGELMRALATAGVRVPDGFAVTAEAFRLHVAQVGTDRAIEAALGELDVRDAAALADAAAFARGRVRALPLPAPLSAEILAAYARLSKASEEDATDVAVRASAAGEDLAAATVPGQHESYLNVRGAAALLEAVRDCMASMFTERALAARDERGLPHADAALSVGVQKMVRSDLASAGVMSSFEPASGHRGVVTIRSAWGLGEAVVKGRVTPDELWVFKGAHASAAAPIVKRERGDKPVEVVYGARGSGTIERPVEDAKHRAPTLTDGEALELARWAVAIEKHFSARAGRPTPMEIEWAKDGRSGRLFVVQARPRTAEPQAADVVSRDAADACDREGLGTLATPRVPVMLNVDDPREAFRLAALPSAGVGLVRIEVIVATSIGVHPMALLHPERLDESAAAVVRARAADWPAPAEFFVDRLATGVGQIAAAFHPRPVLARFSDARTNDFARLFGGAAFEAAEENPALGFRGACRYYDPRYREAFALECAALARVRGEMGLTNVKAMIPFCRTLQEGRAVLEEMAKNGLRRGENDLEVYVMCEVPNNVVLAREFSDLFDGFSIGTNDLAQLALGFDRRSSQLAQLYDERDPGMKRLIEMVTKAAHNAGRRVSLCGQAASDHPELATFLADTGLDSISVTPSALPRVIRRLSGPR